MSWFDKETRIAAVERDVRELFQRVAALEARDQKKPTSISTPSKDVKPPPFCTVMKGA